MSACSQDSGVSFSVMASGSWFWPELQAEAFCILRADSGSPNRSLMLDIVPGRIGIKRAKLDIYRPSGQPTFAFAFGRRHLAGRFLVTGASKRWSCSVQPDPFPQPDHAHKKNLAITLFPSSHVSGKLLLARLRNKRVFRGNPGTLFASHL
jgi:hypothetical protein